MRNKEIEAIAMIQIEKQMCDVKNWIDENKVHHVPICDEVPDLNSMRSELEANQVI